MKNLQEDIAAIYEDLSKKYKIFNPKYDALADGIIKFDASIGKADAILTSIQTMKNELSELVSAIINSTSRKVIQTNFDLLMKSRSEQSEKNLDVMPSISIFKTYIENINNLLVDAQAYVTIAFADNESDRSELIDSLIVCANKFNAECAQAQIIADARKNIHAKQAALDEVEIPQCKVLVEQMNAAMLLERHVASQRSVAPSSAPTFNRINMFAPPIDQNNLQNKPERKTPPPIPPKPSTLQTTPASIPPKSKASVVDSGTFSSTHKETKKMKVEAAKKAKQDKKEEKQRDKERAKERKERAKNYF